MLKTNGTGELERFAEWLRRPPNGTLPKGENTVTAYAWTVERFTRFLDGRPPSQEEAEAFLRSLAEEGAAPNTIARHVYALQAYFAFRGLPLDLEAPARQQDAPRWLSQDEWHQLLQTSQEALEEARTPRSKRKALLTRTALLLYGGAGLRLSEGVALRREDIDPRGYIWVRGENERVVPVDQEVVAALQAWMATHESPWVFPGRHEGHISPDAIQKNIHRLMKKAGLKVSRPMDALRHTVGVELGRGGADEWDIQAVLGHAAPHPGRVYRKIVTEELRRKLGSR